MAIPVTVLVRGSDDEAAPPTTTIPGATGLETQPLTATELGIRVNPPRGWTAERAGGVISLRSPDGGVQITLSAPAGAGYAPTVLSDATAAIHDGYEDVTEVPASAGELVGKRLAGLPAQSTLLLARTHGGTQLRILVAAASGTAHTYLVEVFSASAASGDRLVEAQLALRTLDLTG